MKFKIVCLGFLVLLLFGGCAYNPAFQSGITPGMTTDAVYTALGKPHSVDFSIINDTKLEQWSYKTYETVLGTRKTIVSGYNSVFVITFREGKVVSTKHIYVK